ncbi:S-adenosylmethionine:tRNA ribosyltransferase-isomerase [Spirochaetia bacterium]|nr:S-adenosylmethionine:tRNA ribosyltransferase-isomerase [Spirochaetia bacterium]GHV83584.1 S-adenosylmethionine:tRNA ribosyltransferase-isomerase [Spirochaetia bacterium]
MKTKDFYFDLPAKLIAQHPSGERGNDRLMVVDRLSKKIEHCLMNDIFSFIEKNSLIVFNNSRVRKARLYAEDCRTGAKTEFLLLKDEGKMAHNASAASGIRWQVMMKKARRFAQGSRFRFEGNRQAETADTVSNKGTFRTLQFDKPIDDEWLDKWGHIPLPPYIKRADEMEDAERYQTVYAKETGSAAAPTAGLHWTDELLFRAKECVRDTAFITLHVGAGTFFPVRTENVEDHLMHEEEFFIKDDEAKKIESAKQEGRKIVVCGTTTARCLESAWLPDNTLRRGVNWTSIFIHGDYKFKAADALFTNFHTPESTLLMLVSSFAGVFEGEKEGRKLILECYAQAINAGYKFFSYGDAMLII